MCERFNRQFSIFYVSNQSNVALCFEFFNGRQLQVKRLPRVLPITVSSEHSTVDFPLQHQSPLIEKKSQFVYAHNKLYKKVLFDNEITGTKQNLSEKDQQLG